MYKIIICIENLEKLYIRFICILLYSIIIYIENLKNKRRSLFIYDKKISINLDFCVNKLNFFFILTLIKDD